MAADGPDYMTRQEVADDLGVSVGTVTRILQDGDLYHYRVGKQIRVPLESMTAFKAGRRGVNPYADMDMSTWPPTPPLFTIA